MRKLLKPSIKMLLMLGFALFFIRSGSDIKELYRLAEKNEYAKEFKEAADIYKKLIEMEPENPNFNFKYAINIIRAEIDTPVLEYLEKAAQSSSHRYRPRLKANDAPFVSNYFAGKEAHYLGKFETACTYYNNFIEQASAHIYPEKLEEAKRLLKYAQSGLKLSTNRINISFISLGDGLLPETFHSPIVSPDESLVIFTAPHQNFDDEEPNDDLYFIKKVDGYWQEPKAFDKNFNTSDQEASVSISPDGETFVFFRAAINGGDLFYSQLENDSIWGKPKRFSRPINSASFESHASFSNDGNTIFFTSTRPGGMGGLDIYFSEKDEKGNWSNAKNAGPSINTEYNEESPFVYSPTGTLYFSSDRPESSGGFDIFISHFADSGFTQAANAGLPLNSAYNDLFYTHALNNKHGYTCKNSHRSGAYQLSLVEYLDNKKVPDVLVEWLALNEEGDSLKNMPVTIFNYSDETIIDSAVSSAADGTFLLKLYSDKQYFAAFEKDSTVYFSSLFYIDRNFSGNSFSNKISLEAITLKDSAFRQEKKRFETFKAHTQEKKLSDTSKMYMNLFVALAGEDKIDTISRSLTYTSLADIEIDTIETQLADTPKLYVAKIKPLNLTRSLSEEEILRKRADSLMDVAYEQYEIEQFLPAASNFEKAFIIYEKLDDLSKQIEALSMGGNSFEEIEGYTEALSYHQEALELIRLTGNKENAAQMLEKMGDVAVKALREDQGIGYMTEAIEIRKSLKQDDAVNTLNKKIGDAYYSSNDFKNAKQSYARLQQTSILIGDKESEAYSEFMLGKISRRELKMKQAIAHFSKAIKLMENVDNPSMKGRIFSELGNINFLEDELEVSRSLYLQAIAEFKKDGNMRGVAASLFNVAGIEFKKELYEDAMATLGESMKIAKSLDDADLIARNNLMMSQIAEALKDYENAFAFYADFLNTQGYNVNGSNFLQNQQEVKYQDEKSKIDFLRRSIREKQIKAELEKEIQESTILSLEVEKRNKQILQTIIFLMIGFFAITVLFVLWRLRKNQQFNKILRGKNKEIIAQREEITKQKTELSAINILLEKLSIVSAQTANAVAILSDNLEFEWFNKAYKNMFVPKGEESAPFLSSFIDETGEDFILECIKEKKSLTFQAEKKLCNGETIWINQSLTPIINNGRIEKIISIDSDINDQKQAEYEILAQTAKIELQRDEIASQRDTALQQKEAIEKQRDEVEKAIAELKQTQKKLIEAEKMASLGNLVAGVAHEINTPVGICLAATSSLEEKTKKQAAAFKEKKLSQSDLFSYLKTTYESSKLIVANLNRTGELVQSFKQVSVDEVTEQKRKFKLREYIENLFTSLAPKLQEKKTAVSIECDEELVLLSYPGLFAQIITNFTINSVAHAFGDDSNNQIKIICLQEGENLILKFSDNGKGMSEEVRKKVFNPFFTTNMQAGTGLGMNIVYNLVTQKLEGEIECISSEGKGSEFIIKAPMFNEKLIRKVV